MRCASPVLIGGPCAAQNGYLFFTAILQHRSSSSALLWSLNMGNTDSNVHACTHCVSFEVQQFLLVNVYSHDGSIVNSRA